MKRKFFIATTMILTTAFLASCSACDSCSGETKASFKAYYLENAELEEQVTTINETLTYEVTHHDNNKYNGYTVVYGKGTYTVTLKKAANESTYTLTSKLEMPLQYELNGVSTEILTDIVESKVEFMSTKYSLRPVRSTKTLKSHSPTQASPSDLEDCYAFYHQKVETEYNKDCTKGESVITDLTKEKNNKKTHSFDIEDTDKTTYLDNEQLLFALRCMKPNDTKLQIHSPFSSTQTIAISFDSSKSSKFENLTIEGEKITEDIAYIPVSMEIKAEDSGSAKTAWIAETKNAEDNTYRNVMLKYIVPLPYSLGELHYDLISADFTD